MDMRQLLKIPVAFGRKLEGGEKVHDVTIMLQLHLELHLA